jgi:hypothetical protein
VIVSVALAAGAFTGTVLADPGGWFAGNDNPWPYNAPDTPAAAATPVLAAVGDISCQARDRQGNEKPGDVCTGGVSTPEGVRSEPGRTPSCYPVLPGSRLVA